MPACVFFICRMGTLFKAMPHAAKIGEILPALVAPETRAVLLQMHHLILVDTSGIDTPR